MTFRQLAAELRHQDYPARDFDVPEVGSDKLEKLNWLVPLLRCESTGPTYSASKEKDLGRMLSFNDVFPEAKFNLDTGSHRLKLQAWAQREDFCKLEHFYNVHKVARGVTFHY
jgi:hypothetical protein